MLTKKRAIVVGGTLLVAVALYPLYGPTGYRIRHDPIPTYKPEAHKFDAPNPTPADLDRYSGQAAVINGLRASVGLRLVDYRSPLPIANDPLHQAGRYVAGDIAHVNQSRASIRYPSVSFLFLTPEGREILPAVSHIGGPPIRPDVPDLQPGRQWTRTIFLRIGELGHVAASETYWVVWHPHAACTGALTAEGTRPTGPCRVVWEIRVS